MCPDELFADMVETYGAGVLSWAIPTQATLAAMLPPNARVRVHDNPDAAWTPETFLLRDIEYGVRSYIWGMSDPKSRGKAPQPMLSPSEQKQRHDAAMNKKVLVRSAKRILGVPDNIGKDGS